MGLKAYAIDFVSFIIQKIKKIEQINSIILFGSVARDSESKDSDVDLFIDIKSKEKKERKKLEKEIQLIKEEFYKSIKFKDYWELKGITNEINIITDNLDNWELKSSMIGSSIILYEKYSPKINQGKNKTIISWEVIKPNSKRVMLNKNLFGYNYYGKRYRGLIEKLNAEKIGSNVILINSEDLNEFEKIFKKFKASVKIRHVFEYQK
jgi:predicted nucleotidyltransferase